MLVACFGMAVKAVPAYALMEARPLPTDSRIQTVIYNPNEVYKFTGHYGYQSAIEFAEGEQIATVSVGDSQAWLITPSGSRIFLKPIAQNAVTNMTVITDKRIYYFELHPEETDNIRAKDMVFALRFGYAGEGINDVLSNYLDPVPDPDIDNEPGKYNFNYAITGSDLIAPLRIFDDGQFTYFQFKNKNADIPAFFLVAKDGSESLINFRTRGDYIVVERVTSQFTLRHGTVDVVCVYNEASPLSKTSAGKQAPAQQAAPPAAGTQDTRSGITRPPARR